MNMEMENRLRNEKRLYRKLVPKKLEISKILLDPNNPRFNAIDRRVGPSRISEDSVQKRTMEVISRFGVNDLKESIANIGFLPIDRIVAVPLTEDSENHVVIEGNRRIAAVKSLLQDYDQGMDIDEGIRDSLGTIDLLVLGDTTYESSTDYQLLVQGLRHISGIKSWKPYQQAKAITALVDDLNYSVTDAAKTLGMGRTNASWMRKAFYAFEGMRTEEEVRLPEEDEELISYFSYFVEMLKDVTLRNYFGWNDEENKFTNRREILQLYQWIGLRDFEEEDKARQIPSALDIRKLAQVLSNNDAKSVLEAGGSLYDAFGLCEKRAPQEFDYPGELQRIESLLKNFPSHCVKHMTDEIRTRLESILNIIKEHLGIS
jgi:hypothetical protein